jgi:Pre-toxin TG
MVVAGNGGARVPAVERTGTAALVREPATGGAAAAGRRAGALDSLLAAGNRAIAGLLAPAEGTAGRSGAPARPIRILRQPSGSAAVKPDGGRDQPRQVPDLDVSIILLTGVPPGLAGAELRLFVLMRLGKMSREDAVELLRSGALPDFNPENHGDGTATAWLSGNEPEIVETWKLRRMLAAAGPAGSAGMPDVDLETDADEDSTVEKVVVVVADVATDFAPGVSNVKDALTAVTGVNPVTGEKVGFAGRVAAGIFAIPGLGNVLKYLAKGGRLLAKAVQALGKVLARLASRAPELVKRLRDWIAARRGAGDEIADALPGPGPAPSGSSIGGTGGGGGGGGPSSPTQPGHLADANRQHAEHAREARRTPMGGGFEPLAIEKNLKLPSGKVIRPDAVYVNHGRKLIIIEDVFTGPVEPLSHQLKSWLAKQSTLIQDLVNKGYDVKVVTAMSHPSHRQ